LLSVLLSTLNKKRLKPLVALLECGFSHFFAVYRTRKISAKCFSHAQHTETKEELFGEIRRISFQKIKNGHINLQKIDDEANRKALFTSQFEGRIA
jgi:hypothetical protein